MNWNSQISHRIPSVIRVYSTTTADAASVTRYCDKCDVKITTKTTTRMVYASVRLFLLSISRSHTRAYLRLMYADMVYGDKANGIIFFFLGSVRGVHQLQCIINFFDVMYRYADRRRFMCTWIQRIVALRCNKRSHINICRIPYYCMILHRRAENLLLVVFFSNSVKIKLKQKKNSSDIGQDNIENNGK